MKHILCAALVAIPSQSVAADYSACIGLLNNALVIEKSVADAVQHHGKGLGPILYNEKEPELFQAQEALDALRESHAAAFQSYTDALAVYCETLR